MKTIKSVLTSIGRSPLKSILTFATVGVGVGVLIVALGMSSTFNSLMDTQLNEQGVIISYANAERSTEGELETLRPPQSDAAILEVISLEVDGVEAISPVAPVNWSEFVVGDTTYQIRSILGVNEQYAQLLGLEFIAGTMFTSDEVDMGTKSAIINESLAIMLFGSAVDAIGGTVTAPTSGSAESSNPLARRFAQPTFTVTGVVSDPTELQRQSYGIADMFIPYTAAMPAGANTQQIAGFFLAQGVILVQNNSYETVAAQLNEVLTRTYGDDFLLETWEGGPTGESWYLEEVRSTVTTFSTVINLLGFILLAVASIGILSIMLLEALARSRQIAVERALGAPKISITKSFGIRSAIVTSCSVLIGIVLAVGLSGPLTDLILPIFSDIDVSDVGNVISIGSILIGSVVALLIGGLFGTFPVFSLFKGSIAEAMRSN